tara:strand:- start:913 stop:1257 length:345 start_codon:yes stop_codon:yes gene_type:complete
LVRILPNTVIEDASSASRRLMVFLLHVVLLTFEASVLMSLQIAELSQDSVADGECCHFDEFFSNVFGFQLSSIEGENSRRIRHIAAINTILFIGLNADENLILHEKAVLVLLKS